MYTHILSLSPTFTLTSTHCKLIHKHSLSHHNAFSLPGISNASTFPKMGFFFFLFSNHIFFQPLVLPSGTISFPLCDMLKLCLPSSHIQDSPFCLLLLTLPTVSSLPQVNLCVCVCVCVCARMSHVYASIWDLGGWDEV